MNRTEKNEQIDQIKEVFQKASIAILADYKGIKAKEIADLRREIRKNSGEIKVFKNTLVQKALENTDMQGLNEYLVGTIAVMLGGEDPVAPTKALVKFAKQLEKPAIKVGFFSGSVVKPQQIEALSNLPSREEMLAKLMGSMNAPAQNLVNVFAAIPRQLVTVLSAVRDQKQA